MLPPQKAGFGDAPPEQDLGIPQPLTEAPSPAVRPCSGAAAGPCCPLVPQSAPGSALCPPSTQNPLQNAAQMGLSAHFHLDSLPQAAEPLDPSLL